MSGVLGKTWGIFVLLAFVVACHKAKEPSRVQEVAHENIPEIGEAAETAETKLLGIVNGIPITTKEFLYKLESYSPSMKKTLHGKKHLIDTMVDQILLEAEAKKLGLDIDYEFLKKVKEHRRVLLNNMLLDKINAGLEISDQEALSYFQQHPNQFKNPFEQESERIKSRLISQQRHASKQELLKHLRASGQIKIYQKVLEGLEVE